MQIELTEEQYKEMAELVVLGYWVRGHVAEIRDEQDKGRWKNAQNRILFAAMNNDIGGVAELFHGYIMPADELSSRVEEMMEEYDDDEFWHELEVRLGQRDFYRDVSTEELKKINEDNGWLPDKVHDYYRKYEEEFDKYDIDRLEIKK